MRVYCDLDSKTSNTAPVSSNLLYSMCEAKTFDDVNGAYVPM